MSKNIYNIKENKILLAYFARLPLRAYLFFYKKGRSKAELALSFFKKQMKGRARSTLQRELALSFFFKNEGGASQTRARDAYFAREVCKFYIHL